MELYQIRYFLAVCETLNFARAAERCGVSPSSLTRAVQKLEHELGGLLVRREGPVTNLTELGQTVRPTLHEVLTHVENAKNSARQFLRADSNKPVRLGIMPSIGPLRIAPFLTRFAARNPESELVLVEGDAARLEELLLEGHIEVAVAGRPSVTNRRLRQQRLYREHVLVVFPEGHRFERQEAVRLIELKDECFLLRAHCEKCAVVMDNCRKRGFEPRIVYRGERDDWVQMMVAAGYGVTLMPENLHLRYGTLARPLIDPALERQVSLVTVAGRPKEAHVQHFIRAITAHKWDDSSPRQDTNLLLGGAHWPMITWESRRD